MNNPVLVLNSVSKYFENAGETLKILDDLNLEVFQSTKNMIYGESGCGKSTLLNIIGGLDTPTSGTIKAGKYQIEQMDETALTQYRSVFLGLVFQFHYLLKDFTALENVMLPAYMTGMKKKQAVERAKTLLQDVKLENRMNHYPAQMSGGERQRVAVARALVNNPALVLADEPTGNLDPSNAETVRDILFSVVSQYNNTLILVTHDQGISSYADNCYRLQQGKLILQ
ncbi:ABC transporter ATP-binding protein [Brucepastera parasyntrophica]|uniref:ABC transporter ATP-binding protein n=1 Tax=Brucepastera parasyntrophica TaxID=2880008 RepID=UPI00210D3F54|nr:ABC transporter ATP-binding protein [Brucepastera parasyntrophica]ULQ59936.1 ABC transporter ATP-binding protein [Brucepastera parasyntrophica]